MVGLAAFNRLDSFARARAFVLLIACLGVAGCAAEKPRFASSEAQAVVDTNPGVVVLVDSTVVRRTYAAEKDLDCYYNLTIAREVMNATTKTLRARHYRVQAVGFAAVGLGTTGKFPYRAVRNLRLANTCMDAEPTEEARELVARAIRHGPFDDAQRAALGAPLVFVVGVQGSRDDGDVVQDVIMPVFEGTMMVLGALAGELWAPDDHSIQTSLAFNFALLDTRSGTELWQLERCDWCALSGKNSVTEPDPLSSAIQRALQSLPATVPRAQ